MPVITERELLEAGVHFGHQTRRWNPRMRPYIFTERKRIYIINLKRTAECLDVAYEFVRELAAQGRKILFVGTKKQAQEVVQEEASRCGMYFVNQRWLGGTLTNFVTIHKRIRHLRDLEVQREKGVWANLTKKEAALLEKDYQKLDKALRGIKPMDQLPNALFIVDPGKERIAVLEAQKVHLPIVAMVDTNCNPEEVNYVIPANDDAIKSVRLITAKIADAVLDGQGLLKGPQEEPEVASPAETVAEATA